jgi:hypothetical protein
MMSKRSDAIVVMNENAALPMADVVKLIAERIGVTEANAKSYYRYIVQHSLASGVVVKSERTAKTPRAPKTAKPKMIKVPKPKVQGDKPKITDKTVEEIADIRAKNLARLKAVGRKYAKGQYAEGRSGVTHTDDEAREIVSNFETELDSFKAPKFLNMNQVKALV